MTTQQKIEAIEQKVLEKNDIKNKDFLTCKQCSGLGYYAGHDECLDSEGIHDCSACPIKIHCAECWTRGFKRGYILSLARVLNVLGDRYIYKEGSLVAMIVYDEPIEGEKCYFVEIPRNLRNEDGSDCMLQDQEEETIETLYNIICE